MFSFIDFTQHGTPTATRHTRLYVQEAEARTQEALELAVAVEARKHLEEASERC